MHLTNEDIREILGLLEEAGLDELSLQAPQYHLTLRREVDGWTAAPEVRSPLPETFYRAPKPGDMPFVEIGSRVEEHSVVGLIETMKLFNSVAAGIGVVREILVENAPAPRVIEHGF